MTLCGKLTQGSFSFLIFGIVTAIVPVRGSQSFITERPEFGCSWHGSTLACICQPEAQEFYIQENSISIFNLQTMRISECAQVRFGSRSIREMRNIRHIELNDIKNLTLEEKSLEWEGYVPNGDVNTPSVQISISFTHIYRISSYTFRGRIRQITFNNVTIEDVAPFAFSSLTQTQSIAFYSSEVVNVQPQAFKKFGMEYLTLDGTKFWDVPSRAFSELIVTDTFLVKNCSFGVLRSGAFLLEGPRRMEVTETSVETFHGEAFRVVTISDVLFKNDSFRTTHAGAFFGFRVDFGQVPTRQVFTVEDVTFDSINADVLRVNESSFELKIRNVRTGQACECGQTFVDDAFKREVWCVKQEAVTYDQYETEFCTILSGNGIIIIVIMSVVLILVIIITVALVFYFKQVRNADSYGGKKKKTGKMGIVVPDGRTYRETELHVIVERADLLTTDL